MKEGVEVVVVLWSPVVPDVPMPIALEPSPKAAGIPMPKKADV